MALLALCGAMISAGLQGCQSAKPAPARATASAAVAGASIVPVDFDTTFKAVPLPGPLQIAGAKNEWLSFMVELRDLPRGLAGCALRFDSLRTEGPKEAVIGASDISVFQIISMPVDTNRAGYVRYSGLTGQASALPRALLPLAMNAGQLDTSALRDPANPLDASRHAQDADSSGEPVLLWVDIHIPLEARADWYHAHCDLIASGGSSPVSTVNIALQVYNFVLPDERHLVMMSQVNWESLERLYPDRFEAITPRLVNRTNPVYRPVIRTLDALARLAEANRAEVDFPRLQPTVKWPASEPPEVDWSDYDSVVTPWLSGEAFADKVPVGFWPIPAIDYLYNFDAKSQRDYWSNAATHFNRQDWLGRSAVFLEKRTPGRANVLQSIQLSLEAQRVLQSHPLLRVAVPLEDDQLQFSTSDERGIDPQFVPRIMSAATGLVFGSPTQSWPDENLRPQHWMRTDLPGLVPYVGAGGGERDVRLWAWLAFLKHADLILWSNPLPEQKDPSEPADPSQMVWFYPGKWFGVEGPVPSIQLKWLRRAQEDYEYLRLTAERGMPTNALMLARLMTKQVQIQPVQAPDPEYGLLTGTVDAQTWHEARALLARTILLRQPGESPKDPKLRQAEVQLDLDTIRWQQPKERPFILPRTTQWMWDNPNNSQGDHWAFLRLGIDIYNAGDNRPDQNLLRWETAGDGWEINPHPLVIDSLQTYWVQRFALQARVDLDHISQEDQRKPVEFAFVDGYTHSQYLTQSEIPVAISQRREGGLNIDGELDDWNPADLLQDGPMTRMMDRPSIQHWTIEPASTSSQIYSGWADENFYLAFRLEGLSDRPAPHRNFLDYQYRRAWGEDLAEFLVQPIYNDNSVGPVTYVAVKPNGVCIVRRKTDLRPGINAWDEIDGTTIRYACDPSHGDWTGEIAIPWRLILDNDSKTARLLRFNCIQHRADTGESASWAGPIDFDQDDSFMGLLYLKDSATPGMGSAAR